MIEYSSENLNKLFKKYEMLSKSINLIDDEVQKNNVYFELTKLLNNIIETTNEIYEEKYNEINSKAVEGFEEEKEKYNEIINLINKREEYITNLISKHYIFTSKKFDEPSFLGKFDIDEYKNKIEVIDNYLDNINSIKKHNIELEKINNAIELAKEKINIANSFNDELEVKLKNKFEETFNKNGLYDLLKDKDQIIKIFDELKFILKIQEENIKINNSLSYDIDYQEQKEYEEIEELYLKFNEKIVILNLMEIYDKKTKNYEELIEKREQINDIINKIPSSSIYYELIDFLKEQYDALTKQKEDIKTLNTLEEEKKHKISLIEQLKEENNSDIYKDIVKKMNEQEEQLKEEKRKKQQEEEKLKKKRLLEEQNIRQEEIKRRQKLIEEERKKDMEERAKKLLEEQNKFKKSQTIENNLNKEKVENYKEDQDDMIENPIFKEIKDEIELKKDDENFNINPFKELGDVDFDSYLKENKDNNENNINSILPNSLEDYMKNFDENGKEIFDDDKIFVDF